MTEDALPEDELHRIVVAVHDELARWGIDRFDVPALADRHGLNVDVIRQQWPDPKDLILVALARRPGDDVTPPDSGSLREDLFIMATRMAEMVTSDAGRKLHGGHLIGDARIASVDVRQSAWRARAAGLTAIFERARQRGELREGVDYSMVLELLFAPINMRALYIGEPVDDNYSRSLADLVYRAVAATD